MNTVMITGRLAHAELTEGESPGCEGVVHVCAESGPESTVYRIGVPPGLMDTVMPDLWNERVSVHARVDLGIDMYAMESADPARDDEPDGRKDVEGPGPCRRSITMAELTAALGHAAGLSPDPS